ncbi:uncharacterized protein SCHCODRAFT_02645990 [Schizophyllum commune H4-8]|nr:uncharacterized protein SCHCODRAFT_02645990 [Schizophyllum commune H4-8]KAI5836621.1 hypothetical protein SCHCODRAFT_02645990 [Schizophyllum commune H4-8]
MSFPPPPDASDSVRTPYYRAPAEASPAEAPPSHKKKKGTKDHIPRPANAFILFRADFTKNHKLPDGIEKNNGSLSKIASSEWKSLSPEARRFWDERAEEAKREHQALYPDYKYRPVHGKNSKHKPKELVGVWNDTKEEPEASKPEAPTAPVVDDRWMEGCSTFSVWKADGDDSKRGRGRPPKGLPPPPPKPKKGRKPRAKPVSASSQPGAEVSPEEKEAYERRCAYLDQLSARGVSGEAFEVAKQAWDDAHRLKPKRASPSGSAVDADATEDEGPESESETEATRRPPPIPPPPAPGNAPPRVVASAGSFSYDRPPMPPAMYGPDPVRSSFTQEPTLERSTPREPTPEKAVFKDASPEPDTERVADYPRSFARGEGAPPVLPPFTHTPGEPPRRDSFVRGSDDSADVEMQDAGSVSKAPPSSKRKRSPPSAPAVDQGEKTTRTDESSPAKRPRHDEPQAPSPTAPAKPPSASRASSLTTADGEYDADGDYDMEDGAAEEDEDGIESEDTDYEEGRAKPKPKPRSRGASAKARGRGGSTPAVAKKAALTKKSPPRAAAAVAGRA